MGVGWGEHSRMSVVAGLQLLWSTQCIESGLRRRQTALAWHPSLGTDPHDEHLAAKLTLLAAVAAQEMNATWRLLTAAKSTDKSTRARLLLVRLDDLIKRVAKLRGEQGCCQSWALRPSLEEILHGNINRIKLARGDPSSFVSSWRCRIAVQGWQDAEGLNNSSSYFSTMAGVKHAQGGKGAAGKRPAPATANHGAASKRPKVGNGYNKPHAEQQSKPVEMLTR